MTEFVVMIRDHKWRPVHHRRASDLVWSDRPCAYVGCGKHMREHTYKVSGDARVDGGDDEVRS